MKFREWLLNEAFEWAIDAEVPPEPGTVQIPPNHVRLYTYTKFGGGTADERHQAAESIRTKGLDIGMAQGQKYGEPNVVWASTTAPGHDRVFAEWSIAVDDDRWPNMFRPSPDEDLRAWEQRSQDVYFLGSIKPEEIHCVHEPWHRHYRYLTARPQTIAKVKAGEFDYLIDDTDPMARSEGGADEYGPAVAKAKGSG